MKKLILIFALTFGMFSCSSDDDTSIETSDLYGTWNWTITTGGIHGNLEYTPATTETSLQLKLNPDLSYSIFANDVETVSGIFEVTTKQSMLFNRPEKFISYSDISDKPGFIVLTGMITVDNETNTINISEDAADGRGSSFKKIN